jgi:DNA-binding protein H-NS
MRHYGRGVTACEEEDVDQTRYQDAFGNCWSGEGSLPEWLRRAVAARQNIEHFRSENV